MQYISKLKEIIEDLMSSNIRIYTSFVRDLHDSQEYLYKYFLCIFRAASKYIHDWSNYKSRLFKLTISH